MKWIEIIELRSAGNARKQLETYLREFVDQVEEKQQKQTLRYYTRATLETDFSVHLLHDSNRVEGGGSTLGMRLATALENFGLVKHTIWIEQPKDSFTRLI